MKKRLGWIAAILGVILIYFVVDARMQKQHSIGIIGGADGPTSIFIAGKIGAGELFLGAAVIFIIIVVIAKLIKRWKK